MSRKLYVKRTTLAELRQNWGFSVPSRGSILYIRCNSKGIINWDKAPVFTDTELANRGNVVIMVAEPAAIDKL